MLIWLLEQFDPLLTQVSEATTGDSRIFLTARIAVASVLGFLFALLGGGPAIRWLRERFTERIDSASERLNQLQTSKNATPTMGGLFVMAAVFCAIVIAGDLRSSYVQASLFLIIGFGGLGALDDWVKLSTERNGLSARQKFITQLLLSLVIALVVYYEQRTKPFGTDLVSPIGSYVFPLGAGFVAWAIVLVTGTSNAVNLTDGLDGLATGCTIFAGTAFTALAYVAGHAVIADYLTIPFISGAGEMSVVIASLVGAMLGFLWFNCYPAQVFMGDTGSLPVGALLGLAALVTRQELLLAIIGGVFVIETLSVILQVGWYRLTGNRLIACSPLHNHFLFRGQHEIKIVTRFWIGSALLAIVGIASLKLS
jgi:phospho-N-acetylmuramoyl-pentapeptide-transferase